MMRILWVIIMGASALSLCTAAEPMEDCRLAIMDFNDPVFDLPPCDMNTRWLMSPALQCLPPSRRNML